MKGKQVHLAVLVGLAMFSVPALAQPGRGPQGSVRGTVADSASGRALSGATVALWNAADSNLVTGAIVERDGGFAITGLMPGNYYAKITYVGYTPRLIGGITIEPGKPVADLGRVILISDVARQEEVTVTAERDFMSVGIDRTIYKTGDLAVASGGNATDVLRNIPTVEVDANGRVSLRGNQNVAIQLNGRPLILQGDALTNFLRSLPAESLERVEVVTNPSAKYDPEGMGGIINIVLDQQTSRGLSGGFNGTASSNRYYGAGFNLSYGDGPWNVFGSYSYSHYGSKSQSDRLRRSYINNPPLVINQTTDEKGNYPGHSLNASVDYSVGASTFSLSAIASINGGKGTTMIRTSEQNLNGDILRRYERSASERRNVMPMDYRAGYKLVMDPGKHELTAEARWNQQLSDIPVDYRHSNLPLDITSGDTVPQLQRSEEDHTVSNYALQVDYVRPLWDGSTLETGYLGEADRTKGDYTLSTFDNGGGVFVREPLWDNNYDYQRQTHAVYGTLGQEFGDFTAQVGVRVEQAFSDFTAHTIAQSFENDYLSVFPSAFLNYKASDALQFKASYSRRIQRPWIESLNPTLNFVDPTFRFSGNPYLKPEYTNSYEFTAVWFGEKSSLTLTPFYRHSTDLIRRYDITDTNGVSTVTFLNFDENKSYGADLIGSLRVGDWMNSFASASVYKTVTDAGNVEDELGSEGVIWMLRGNASFVLMQGLNLQVSYFYRAPMNIENGEIGPYSQFDIALQQQVFGDRGRIGIRASDPFKWAGFSVVRDEPRFYQEFDQTWNSHGFYLTFSYNFGAQDRMQRRNRGAQPPSGGGGGGMDGYGM